MRKFQEVETPAKVDPVKGDSSSKLADAIQSATENNLLAMQIAGEIERKLGAGFTVHADALKEIVARITATREVSVEVTRRDQDGKIKSLKITSTVPKLALH